jgi:2-phosphosulfolactate phosphatase
MVRQIYVHLLPELTTQEALAGSAVVVIDVLRASSTVTAALANGVSEVIPCLDVAEARSLARDRTDALLGGERLGQKISGFDLGNSPAEYQGPEIAGRPLVFTTTNGTRALMMCVGAAPVWMGSFANLSAIVRAASRQEVVHLLCAGTNRRVSSEDVLFAGAVVDRLDVAAQWQGNDAARLSLIFWRAVSAGQPASRPDEAPPWLVQQLLDSHGGRNLAALGMEDDVRWAARVDRYDVLPQLDHATWSIRMA